MILTGTYGGYTISVNIPDSAISITPIAPPNSGPSPAPVPPAPPPVVSGVTMSQLGYVGINLESHNDWHMNRYYVNVIHDSRGFECAAGVDPAGWPLGPWQNVLSTKNGACPPGIYKGRYSGSVGKQVWASAGCTLTETSIAGGYVNFDLTVPAYVASNGNKIIAGNAVTNLEIVRPGFMPGVVANPLFNPDSINVLKFANSIRYMKPLGVECLQMAGSEVLGGNWATRNTPANRQGGFSGIGMPHEWVIFQANVLYAAGGSLKTIHINLFHTVSDEYVLNVTALYKALLNPAIKFKIEYSNEHWNPMYVAVFNYMLMGAMADVDGAYGKGDGTGFVNRFASVSCGGKNAKIIFKTPHNKLPGDKISFSNFGTWNYSGPCTVVDPLTLTFPFTLAAATLSVTSGIVYIGKPNTGVSYDGAMNINLLMRRFYAKRCVQIAALVESVMGSSVSGQAQMVMGQQQPDGNNVGGMAESVLKYLEDSLAPRKVNELIYSVMLHPYTDQALPNTATTKEQFKALLDTSILRNALELKRFKNLLVCYGLRMEAYEWGPSFLNNGVAGSVAGQLALQNDVLMQQHTEAAWAAFAATGMEVQHFFHYTACDDWNVQDGSDGNLNWYAYGDLVLPVHTPKTMAIQNVLSMVPVVNDALNLISGDVSVFDAPNHGRVDLPVPGNNLGWTNANAGTPGAGAIGYDRAGSTTAIGVRDRWIEFGVLVTLAGPYSMNVWAFLSGSGLTESLALTLDDVPLAAYPMPALAANKAGNFINQAAIANSEVAVTLPAGFHRLRITVPASTSGAFALRKLVFTKQ